MPYRVRDTRYSDISRCSETLLKNTSQFKVQIRGDNTTIVLSPPIYLRATNPHV